MEIRRNWKILVGIFICAIGIMFNGSVNAHATSLYAENRFEVMEEIDNPENYNGGYYAGEERNFTYKVTPKETGIYKIYSETDPEKEGYYNQNSLRIYAFNESKQVITTLDGIGIDGEKVYVEANIYMVKGKSYYIGFRTYDIEGKFVEVTMSKTNLVAQPKMEYDVQFDRYYVLNTGDPVKGNYNWDSENATLTFDNCEIGPCSVDFSAINKDRPNGEKYYFAVDDFPNVKNIKVVFKGENKCQFQLNTDSSSVPMFFVCNGNNPQNDYVNVGIELTGGGTVDIDEEYSFRFIDIEGDVILNDITLNFDWEKSEIGKSAFETASNLIIKNSTIKSKIDYNDTMFVATADIIVDDSQFCINAVWGDGWKDNLEFNRFAGIFYASDEVLLNSGELLIAADPEYLELLEKNKYCSIGMKEEGVEINKDKFTYVSVNNVDISKLKYTLENTTYIYDGKAKTPKVTIPGLVEGKHFEVKYSDNVNVGKAKFTVTGIGMFTGKIEGTFEIKEKQVENKKTDESVLTDGKLIYKKLADASADGKTAGKVQVVGLQKKNLKKITIKAVVTLDGKKYNVTSIAANAFKGNKKITKVTIGKNVTTIGKKAFFGCKKLKTVKINSKKLKVGKKAFYRKGGKKLTIRVPKKLKKKYKKAFKKAKTNKFIVK